MSFAAILVETNPAADAILAGIIVFQAEIGGDARKFVDYYSDQGPVAKANRNGNIDTVEWVARLFGGKPEGFPLL